MAKSNTPKSPTNFTPTDLNQVDDLYDNPVIKQGIADRQRAVANTLFPVDSPDMINEQGLSQNKSEYDRLKGSDFMGSSNDIEHTLGERQSSFNQLGHTLLLAAPMTAIKLAESVSNLDAGLEYLTTFNKDTLNKNAQVDSYLNGISNELKQALPIHATEQYDTGSLTQKLMSSKFWTDDLADGLEFVLAQALFSKGIGGAAGAVGKGVTELAGATNLGELYQSIPIAQRIATAVANKFTTGTVGFLNAASISAMQAKGTGNQIEQKLRQKFASETDPSTGENYTPQAINEKIKNNKDLIEEKTGNTFWATMATELLPSVYAAKLFLGGSKAELGEFSSAIIKKVNAGELTLEEIENGVGYDVLKKTGWKEATREATKAAVVGGPVAMNLQTAIQKFDVDQGVNGISGNAWDSKIGYAKQFLDNFTTDEGVKGIVMGSLLGAATGAFHSKGVSKEYNESLAGHLDSLKAADSIYGESVRNIYKTDPRDPNKLLLDQDGKPIEDVDKLTKLTFQILHDKNNWDNQTAAILAGNSDMATLNEHVALSQSIVRELTSGRHDSTDSAREWFKWFHKQRLTEQSMQALKEQQDNSVVATAKEQGATPQEGATAGIETQSAMKTGSAKSDAELSKRVNASSALIDTMFNGYDKTSKQASRLSRIGDTLGKMTFNDNVGKTLFYEEVKRNAIDEMLKDRQEQQKEIGANQDKLAKEVDVLANLKQDSENRSSDYLNKTDELYQEWDKFNKSRESLLSDRDQAIQDNQSSPSDSNKRKMQTADYIHQEFVDKEGIAQGGIQLIGQGKTDPFIAGTNQFSINQDTNTRIQTPVGLRNEFQFNAGNDYTKMSHLRNMIAEVKSGSGSLKDTIDYANDNISHIDEDTRKQLNDLVSTERTKLEQDKQKLSSISEYDEDGFNPEYEKLAYDIHQNEDAIKSAAEVLRKNTENTALDRFNHQPGKIEEYLNKKFAAKSFIKADNIIANAIEPNGQVKETYTDSRAVNQAIEQLTKMRNALDDRTAEGGDLAGSPAYDYLIHQADKKIAQLEKVARAVEDNKVKRDGLQRAINQREANVITTSLGFDLSTGSVSYQPIFNITNQILDGKFNDMVKQIKELPSGNFYEGAMAMLHSVKVKGTSEQLDTLIGLISDRMEEIAYELPSITSNKNQGLEKGIIQSPELYFDSYIRALDDNTQSNGARVYDYISDEKNSPISEFRRTNDIDQLQSRIASLPEDTKELGTSKEVITKFIQSYKELVGLSRTQKLLNSSLDLSKIVGSEIDLAKNGNGIVPTAQQEVSVRDGAAWINSKDNVTDKAFSGWGFLRGIAGTGKTSVVVKWITDLSGLKPEEIQAIAISDTAARAIGESIKAEPKTVQELMSESIDRNKKLLIVDEYARIQNEDIRALESKIREENKTREPKDRIRVMILGDPTQITPYEYANQDITNPVSNRSAKNIIVINPLTVVYRSEVSAVNETSDLFQDNPDQVQSINVRADRDMNSPLAIGSHTGKTGQDIIDIVKRNQEYEKQNGFTPRTRVIISSKPEQYTGLGVPVVSVYDAQSSTYDEAYVDLSKGDFNSTEKYNTALYTAASRAREYSYVKYPEGINTTDPGLGYEKENNDTVGRSARGEYIKARTEEQTMMDAGEKGQSLNVPKTEVAQAIATAETPLTKVTDPELNTEDEEVVTETPSSSSEEILPTELDPEGYIDPETEATKEPTNLLPELGHNLPNIEGDAFNALNPRDQKLDKGSRAVYMYTKEKNGQNAITIFGIDKDNNWVPISKIFQEEIDKHPAYVEWKKIVSEMQPAFTSDPQRLNATGNKAGYSPEDLKAHIVQEGKISQYQRLTYKFRDISKQGSDIAQHIKDIFKQKFFHTSAKEQSKADKIHFKIFRNNELSSQKFGGFTPEVGIPYAIVGTEPGSKDYRNAQFVRLTANKLDKESEHYQALKQYRDLAKHIENETGISPGTTEFNKVIRALKKGLKVEHEVTTEGTEPKLKLRDNFSRQEFISELDKIAGDSTDGSEIDPTGKLSDKQFNKVLPHLQGLASMFYGIQQNKAVMTEAEMKQAYGDEYEHIPLKDNSLKEGTEEPLGRVRLKGTGPGTGKKEISVYSYDIKANKGIAQEALNQIAKANEFVGNVRIRVDDMKTIGKANRATRPTGKSLISDAGAGAKVGIERKVLARILGKIQVHEGKLEPEDLERKDVRINLEKQVRELAGTKNMDAGELGAHLIGTSSLPHDEQVQLNSQLHSALTKKETPPISMRTLDMMVGDENYTNGEHTTQEAFNVKNPHSGKVKETQTYLRKPLDINQFNELGRDPIANSRELASMVGTKFDDIIPTSITVAPIETSGETIDRTAPIQPEPTVPGSKVEIQSKIDELTKQIIEAKGREKLNLLKEQKKLMDERDNSTRLFDENVRRSDTGRKISIDEAQTEIRRMLPNIINEEIQFVNQSMMSELQNPGESLLGLYNKGQLIFSEQDGTVGANVVRHEVFHKVFNEYLSQRERNTIAKEFDPEGKLNPRDLEEAMADGFMTWQNHPESFSSKVRRIFNRILNMIGFARTNGPAIENLFRKIDNGDFQIKDSSIPNSRMTFSDIRKYGTVQDYKTASRYVQGLIYDNFIDNNIKNIPLTQAELFEAVSNRIKDIHSELDSSTDAWVEAGHDLRNEWNAETDPQVKTELEGDIATINDTIIDNNQKLKMLNILSDSTTLKDMWNDIYPNFKFRKEGIVSFDENAQQEDPESVEYDEKDAEKKDTSSIRADFVQQSDERNNETKVSENVKNFLSFIYRPKKVGKGSEKDNLNRRVNPRGVYLQLLRGLSGLQSSDADFIQQVTKRAGENGIDLNGRSDAALIINHVLDLYHNATDTKYEFSTGETDSQGRTKRQQIDLAPHMRFLDENTFIIAQDGSDLSSVTKSSLPDNISVIDRSARHTSDFLKEVGNIAGTDEAKAYFRQYQAQETLRELMSNFLSQRESTPMIAEEVRGFKTVLKYFRAQNYGIERIKTSELENNFKENWSKITPETWSAFIKPSNLSDGKAKAIATLLKTLGIEGTDKISSLSNNTVNSVHGDIQAFKNVVDSITKDNRSVQKIDISDSDESFDLPDPVTKALEQNSGMLDRITRLLTSNSSESRASSYTDTTGQKRYLFHNGSQAHDTLSKILGFVNDKIGKLPKFLTEDTILSKNIFGENGINQIYEILDHDGQRQEGKEEFATGYSSETNAQWLKRNFSDGFLTFIKTNARNNADPLTYMQNFYTISNRPRMIGARVKVLSEPKIEESLIKAIEQHLEQPDLKEVKNYDRFKAINFDEFHKAVEELHKDRLSDRKVSEMVKNTEERAKLGRIYDEISEDPKMKQDLARHIIGQLKEHAESAMELMKKENITLGADAHETMKLLKDPRRPILGNTDPILETEVNQKQGWPDTDLMRSTVQSFYMNNYVNSYFLNQAVVGNYNFFKSALDVVKRMSGVFAPGTKGIIGDKFFLKQKFNIAVAEDPKMTRAMLSPIFEDTKLQATMKAKGFDLADAQGFMLPERAENLVQGFGSAYNAGAVFKPAHYEIAERTFQDGTKAHVPVMLKYSSVVLSDSLTSRFPKLEALRSEMRRTGAHEFIFDSGVKAGAPEEQVKLPLATDYENNTIQIKPEHIIELSNENYRLQLNPNHDAYDKVSNPTQLGYFLNVMHKLSPDGSPNRSAADTVYNAIGEKISRGITKLSGKGFTDIGGKFNISAIKNMLTGSGNERIQEMLSSGLDYNMPNIADKAMIQMANLVDKETVKIKFPGGKLVLQSSYGADIKDPVTNQTRRLMYQEDSSGRWHAEVLLPNSYQDKVQTGSFLTGDGMGFRIPSTELHSGLPLKIVGFYDDKGSNVVIAPAELVAQHGSDFDVDSLYALTREIGKRNIDDLQGNPISRKNQAIGYYPDKNGLIFNPIRFRNELDQAKIDYAGDKTILNQLEKVHDQFLNNQIAESFMDVISDKTNKQRMLSPISTDIIDESFKALGIGEDQHVNLSRLQDNLQVYNSNFQGASLVGIFANGMKSLSYMSRAGAGEGDQYPQLHPDLSVQFASKIFDKFTELDSEKGNAWEQLDALVNTSVDNVKEQKLYHMNATDRTGPAYIAAKAIGMSLTDSMRLMLQPVVKLYSSIEGGRGSIMTNLKKAMIEHAKSLDILSEGQGYEQLRETIKQYTGSDNLTQKSLDLRIKETSLGNTPEEFANQFHVLEQFEKIAKIGDDITTFSRAISILQNMPVFYQDIAAKIEQWNKLGTITDGVLKTNEDFSFNLDKLFQVQPNIKEAYNAFQWMKSSVDKSLIKHFPEVESLVDNLSNNTKLRLQFDKFGNREALKNEIMSYLISSHYAEELKNQEPVTVKRTRGESILTGRAAWSQDFSDRVKKEIEADKKEAGENGRNPFLKRLSITEKYGIKSLNFANTSNPDSEEALEMQEGFANIKDEQLKQDFVKYAVLNYGMSFGTRNYSMFIPSEYLKPISDFITKNIKSKVQSSTVDSEGKLIAGPLKNIEDNLSIRMAVNNVEKLSYIDNKKIPAIQSKGEDGKPLFTKDIEPIPIMSGYNGEYFWHRAYDNPLQGENGKRKFTEDDLPAIIRKRDGNGRESAYYKVNDVDNDQVFYQRIGYKNYSGGYDATNEAINGGYNIEDYFGKGTIPVPVPDARGKEFTVRNEFIKEGQRVIVYPYSNDTRELGQVGIVDKVRASLGDKDKITFTLRTDMPVDTKPEQQHLLDIAHNVANRFGLKVSTDERSFMPKGVKGIYSDGIIYLNTDLMTRDTVFHEVAHPLISAIKQQNPQWYKNLSIELETSKEGKSILLKVQAKYPELSKDGQEVEALVTAIGQEAAKRLPESNFRTLVRRLMRSVGNIIKSVINEIRGKGGISLETLQSEDMAKLTIGDISDILATKDVKLNLDLSKVKQDSDIQYSKDLGEEKPASSLMEAILSHSERIEDPIKDESGQEGDTYKLDGTDLSRVSKFLDNFTFREKKETLGPDGKPLSSIDAIAKRTADNMFKSVAPGGTLIIDGVEQTRDEYEAQRKLIQIQAIAKGDIIHANIQKYMAMLNGDTQKVIELENRIAELSSKVDKLPTAYNWVTTKAVFSKLMENAGINIGSKVPKELQDKVYAEIKVGSSILGISGRIDKLIEKADGRLRIVDWKTGSRLKDKYSANILKYGVQENRITDNPLDRAKLQAMTYALIIKAEHPEARFDGLVVMHLPNEYEATQSRNALAVEVPDYLRMMEQYYRNEEPAIYRQLLEKSPKIFDPREYNAPINPDFIQDVLNSNGASEAETLEKAKLDLQKLEISIEMRKAEEGTGMTLEESKLREKLLKKILQAASYVPVDFTGSLDSKYEVSVMTRYLGNLNDTHNPYIQSYAQLLTKARQEANTELDAKKLKFRNLLSKVQEEKLGKRGVISTALTSVDKAKLFANLWNEVKTTDTETNTAYIRRGLTTEKDQKWNSLSANEKALSVYMRTEMKNIFNEVMITGKNSIVGTKEKGQPMTKLDLYNSSRRGANFKYEDDFVPRIAITKEEVFQKAKNSGLSGIGNLAKDRFLRLATDYFENNIEGYNQKDYGLPVRFLGNGNTYVSPDTYSMDLELAFNKYMEQMVNKKHLDHSWVAGSALKGYLESKNDMNGNPAFKNATNFLDFHMNNILIGDRIQRGSKGLTRHGFTVGRKDGQEYNISPTKIYRTMKSGIAAGTLWLQPERALKNAVQQNYMLAKESAVNSIGKLVGIQQNELDLSYKANAGSYKEAIGAQWDIINGKGTSNWIHVLAKQLRLYPNMEVHGQANDAITRGSTLLDTRHMGYLYQAPEEITTVMQTLNFMKNMKIETGKYQGKTIYDMYKDNFKKSDNGDGYFELPADFKRGKIQLQDGTYEDLAGLHPLEVQKIQRGIQKIKGGYKPDEKTAIQATVLGDMLMMFKRWIPSMMVHEAKSKYTDPSIGQFELQRNGDSLAQREGEPVYEWRARVVEGRARVVANMFMNMVGLNKQSGYNWSDMSGEQKKSAIDLSISLATWMGMLGITYGVLGHRKEKDSLKALSADMTERFFEQWSVPAMLNATTQPPAMVKKTLDVFTGFEKLIAAGYHASTGGQQSDIYTNKGDVKGANEIMKNTPILSSYYEMKRFNDDLDKSSPYNTVSPF